MSELDVASRSAQNWKKSAKHGAGEWLAERFTSLALIPLTLWAAYAAFTIAGGGFNAALAFAQQPVNMALIAATVLITVWHMYMGLKVIIDDYLLGPMRGFLLFVTFALCAGTVIATAGALYYLYRGA